MAHARQLKEAYGVDWPVLVDDLEGTVHRLLDTKQNSVHIAGADGQIVFRALFAGAGGVAKAIAAVAESGRPHKSQIHGMLTGAMKSIGISTKRCDTRARELTATSSKRCRPWQLWRSLLDFSPSCPKPAAVGQQRQ